MNEELIGFWKNLSLDSIRYIDPNDGIEKVEQWKDIDGWAGYYMISDLGRIKSIQRIVMIGHNKTAPFLVNERILKQSFGTRGHLSVILSIDGKCKTYRPSILVAKAFIANPEDKEQVNHIKTVNNKAIKTLNTIYNLEWNTPTENVEHALKNKLYISFHGQLNDSSILSNIDALNIFNSTITAIKNGARWGKVTNKKYKPFNFLTREQVLDIYYSKEMGTKLAQKYGITKDHISRIRNGHKCSSITGHKKSS